MAPRSGSHPFMYGCGEIPKEVSENIRALRAWIEKQPALPNLTDEHLYMFLHSNYNDLQKTQTTVGTYFAVRSATPEMFIKRSPVDPDIQSVLDMLYLVPLPKTTPEGYRVLMYKLRDTEPSKFNHANIAKTMILFSDICTAEHGICPGYIIIGDPRGFSASHLTKINLGVLRIFMKYMQEAKPVRMKGIHIVHSAKIMEKLVAVARPFMKTELTKILHIHSGSDLTNLYKSVPRDILPEEYGGKEESLEVLHGKVGKPISPAENAGGRRRGGEVDRRNGGVDASGKGPFGERNGAVERASLEKTGTIAINRESAISAYFFPGISPPGNRLFIC
ncbi:UNVERIFIED_CONTAM: hypothetical protein PYX00_009050 [Menopon gallinae]|uniref:CRAL-TRIO domain-containing protein n=1 Tax=Menopon gallinae TaxID=328185 RepID=A0AAW2H9U2_9NEOP